MLLAALALVPELWLVAGTAPLAAIVVAGLFGGAGLILGNTVWETTLQQRIPADVLSRVSAYDWLGSLAFLPLGYALAGPLAAVLGATATLWLSGVIVLVAIAAITLAVPEVRELDPAATRPQPAVA